MNTPYQNLYWIKRMGQTVRFHGTNPLTRPETVFHHSASVAAILLQIVPEECTFELLVAAIIHDIPEGVTGDIPAPIKMLLDNSKLEKMEEDVLSFYNMLDDRTDLCAAELTTAQKFLFKSADRLDAMLTCLWNVCAATVKSIGHSESIVKSIRSLDVIASSKQSSKRSLHVIRT